MLPFLEPVDFFAMLFMMGMLYGVVWGGLYKAVGIATEAEKEVKVLMEVVEENRSIQVKWVQMVLMQRKISLQVILLL